MPNNPFGIIPIQEHTGEETFRVGATNTKHKVGDFWRWAHSDLISNVSRGILAEYLVRCAVGATDQVRDAWGVHDVITPAKVTIQVKATAYLQAWFQKKLTPPAWDIAPKRAWDAKTNILVDEVKRHSDVYVFCLQAQKDQPALDPLDLSQWCFFVCPTKYLDEQLGVQKTASLTTLQRIGVEEVSFDGLNTAVASAAAEIS